MERANITKTLLRVRNCKKIGACDSFKPFKNWCKNVFCVGNVENLTRDDDH